MVLLKYLKFKYTFENNFAWIFKICNYIYIYIECLKWLILIFNILGSFRKTANYIEKKNIKKFISKKYNHFAEINLHLNMAK